MATKKELLQAQTFSRRRLLTAFVSGAPGGRELEPAKPLRGVVIGAVLSVLVVLGSLIAGAFTGEQDENWKENSLVLVRETGARYVAINGELYPVHNVTSARLLAFSDSFEVVNLREDQATGVPRGTITVGIPGAPDALPPSGNLINNQWIACAIDDTAVRTSLNNDNPVATPGGSRLVRVGEQHYFVHGDYRYEVAAADVNAFSLFLGFDANPDNAAPVSARWLRLFTEGEPLQALSMAGDGEEPPGPLADLPHDLAVGDVVLLRDGQGETGAEHVVNDAGELVELSPFALELYYLGSGRGAGGVVTLEFAEAQQAVRTTSDGFVPPDWPLVLPEPLDPEITPCVQLDRDADTGAATLHLIDNEESMGDRPVEVDSGYGALVRLDAGGTQAPWAVVDEQGIMYQIPPGHDQDMERLGYQDVEAPRVQAGWADLFTSGPVLTIESAISGLPQEAADIVTLQADPGDGDGDGEGEDAEEEQ